MRKAEAERAATAYATRPTLYKTTGTAAPQPQHLLAQPGLPIFLPLSTASQGPHDHLIRTIRNRARQLAAPAAGERAEDGFLATAKEVGEMEDITSTPPLPPSQATTPQAPVTPAIPTPTPSSTPLNSRPRIAGMVTARPEALQSLHDSTPKNPAIQCPYYSRQSHGPPSG